MPRSPVAMVRGHQRLVLRRGVAAERGNVSPVNPATQNTDTGEQKGILFGI